MRKLCLVAATLAGLAGGAAADTVTLEPNQDNTLYEDAAGGRSNGSGQHLFSGATDDGLIRRAVLRFDVAGSLPAGASVTSARLTLNMSRTNGGAASTALHALTSAWGESTSDAGGEEGRGATSVAGDATWLHTSYDTATWTTPGGDFAATASASLSTAARPATPGARARRWWPTSSAGWTTRPRTSAGS